MEKNFMRETKRAVQIRSYCAQCHSKCPIICSVKDGKLERIRRDPGHPNTSPLCIKGLNGPELVYNRQRLKYPLKRTRPKGEQDPGWERISWDEAMETIAQRLMAIKQKDGPHTVAFNRPGPSGAPAIDFGDWVVRLAFAFGSPNNLATGHVCKWHRDTGSKYTYGWGKVPEADFENTALLIVWGHNPHNTGRCNLRDIRKAKKRGVKIVVIDPRLTPLAKNADLWLQIRPGTDGALILGLIHLIIRDRRFDESFVKNWTNAPFLVDEKTKDLLSSEALGLQPGGYIIWDKVRNGTAVYHPDRSDFERQGADPELSGPFQVKLSDGTTVSARPVFCHLNQLVNPYDPDKVASITGVAAQKVIKLANYLGEIKPASYYSFNGIEQHTNAMQTNRALCILYTLTGNLDNPGGNVIFPSLPGVKIRDPKCLPEKVHKLRLGYYKKPLGPAGLIASSIQAYDLFESVLSGKPYPIKALIAFGGNTVTANSHSVAARNALKQLDFFVQTELFMTPSAELADIVLPAATFYESYHLRIGFPNSLAARQWVQYRPQIIPPLYESRPDIEIIFDLAARLGLKDQFWDGDIEAAFNTQLKPLDLDLDTLKKNPAGMAVEIPLTYRKYASTDNNARTPKGFPTASRRVEIYSQLFKDYGYDPLPVYREPLLSPKSKPEIAKAYPFVLTCNKLLYFCHGQHRGLPSLRKAIPHPFVEIHPMKARELNIEDDEWVRVETPAGKIRLRSKLTEGISPDVVCIQHGWWQSCPELKLPGYDPYSADGANANLLYDTEYVDAITGSVPYKSYLCNISKIGNSAD